MKFTTVFAVLATFAAAVSATFSGASELLTTNAKRLANGMAPLPPHRRGTPTHGGKKSSPSSISNSCNNNGSVHCCNKVTKGKAASSLVSEVLGLVIAPGVGVGLDCTLGVESCTQQRVCCENNEFSGPVVIGCSNLNI